MNQIQFLLRLGVFGIFLGHGIFAFQGNPDWIPFLSYWGFSHEQSVQIMPIIGVIDILVAVISLIKPLRIVLIYATVWAFATALMRPLCGAPIWAFVERAGNWIVPLSLLLILKHQASLNDN